MSASLFIACLSVAAMPWFIIVSRRVWTPWDFEEAWVRHYVGTDTVAATVQWDLAPVGWRYWEWQWRCGRSVARCGG